MIYAPLGNIYRQIVSTGVAIPLSALSQPAVRVDIQAPKTNSGPVWIGDGSVKNDFSNGGQQLFPGDTYNLTSAVDLVLMYVNGSAGDGVSVNWYQAQN